MLPGWFVGLVGLVLLRLLGMFECRFLYQPPVSLSSLSIFGHTASNSLALFPCSDTNTLPTESNPIVNAIVHQFDGYIM